MINLYHKGWRFKMIKNDTYPVYKYEAYFNIMKKVMLSFDFSLSSYAFDFGLSFLCFSFHGSIKYNMQQWGVL